MLEEKGLDNEAIEKELRSRLAGDINFDSGNILGSMCTRPHPLGVSVFTRYIEKNAGDPGLVADTVALEEETIGIIGSMLSLPRGAAGYIVTGGTEANILALWTARKRAGKKDPEVILPDSAHFSFDKAADLLGLRLRKIPSTPDSGIDIKEVRKALNGNTIALVGVAGTTSLGTVDPVDQLSKIALEKGLYLHVDAALGGFVLPFLKELGYRVPPWDFSRKGVSSITIDPHKMGMAVIPSGGIIYRNNELAETIRVPVPYLSGGENAHATIVGTRSGASVLAVWALLRHLGRSGYRNIVRRCMDLARETYEQIRSIDGVEPVREPVINVLGIGSSRFDIGKIAGRLRERGWAISLFPSHIRLVFMPHVYPDHMKGFLDDLRDVCALMREEKE